MHSSTETLADDSRRVPPGLDGIVVADTSVGAVHGDEGYFQYRGHSAAQLAREQSIESIWYLLHNSVLPTEGDMLDFVALTGAGRSIDTSTEVLLDHIAGVATFQALRTALSFHGASLEPWVDRPIDDVRAESIGLIAPIPTMIAHLWRRANGQVPLAADPSRGLVEDYLRMLSGTDPHAPEVRAVEQYLGLTVDHGLNASTFVARCTASSGADLGAVLVAGIGSLSGPLHGGAPSLVLDMLDEIERSGDAAAWVESRLAKGQRVMGFGHRIYRTEDPRAALLRETAIEAGGPRIEAAIRVEELVVTALAERYPDRDLRTNVEFYAAVALEQAGLPRQLFTPTFAISRAIGWMAHAIEQISMNRIIRPSSSYVGPIHN